MLRQKSFFFVITIITTLLLLLLFKPILSAGEEIGYLTLSVPVDGGYEVPCAVWYPASGGGDGVGDRVIYDFSSFKIEGTAIIETEPLDTGGPWPLIVYSHGYSGCPFSSYFLCEALAAVGFIVIAPDHTDDIKSCVLIGDHEREVGFGVKLAKDALVLGTEFALGTYDPADYRYRYMELSSAIDAIINISSDPESQFYGKVDISNIGAVGHSLGAFSVMAMAIGLDRAYDSRIGAVVALSGPGGKVFSCDEIKKISVPVMLMYGGDEKGRDKPQGLETQFDCLFPPRFIVSIAGGRHLTFSARDKNKRVRGDRSGGEEARHDLIVRYVTAFFRLYLMENVEAEGAEEILEHKDSGIEYYDFEF